jgi:hypothetical protein
MEESDRMAILLDRANICLDRNNLQSGIAVANQTEITTHNSRQAQYLRASINVDMQEVFLERKNEHRRLKNQNGNPGALGCRSGF